MQEEQKVQIPPKSPKTWEEALGELKGFIIKSRQEEKAQMEQPLEPKDK